MKDIPENSCDIPDCIDYKTQHFNICVDQVDDYLSYYYQSGGKTKHFILLLQ